MSGGDHSFMLPGGPAGVLLVHGLTGTPTEMRYLARGLNAAGYTVHAMQLAGHCGSEADLVRTGWPDWYASVEAALARLERQCRPVFAAGLSMGAVMALLLAARHPGRLAGIGCYSTTLRYDGWSIPRSRVLLPLLPLVLKLPFGNRYRFEEAFPYGIKDDRLRQRMLQQMQAGDSAAAGLPGMPGATLHQLQKLIRRARAELPRVTAPTLLVHAREDDVTSPWNADLVQARVAGPVTRVDLDDCYHMVTVDRQRARVVEETLRFLAGLTEGGLVQARGAAE
jgi:carboxylesterase